jgi:hypothetical protein
MKYLFCVFLIAAFSCNKEKTTYSRAYWINATSHHIEVRPIGKGIVISQNVVRLLPGSKLEIAASSFRDIVNRPMFDSRYFEGADSLIVVYDSLYTITHYANTPIALSPKHYLFSSTRNIGNPNSYKFEFQDKSKHKRETFNTFTFTEQDYLDAK